MRGGGDIVNRPPAGNSPCDGLACTIARTKEHCPARTDRRGIEAAARGARTRGACFFSVLREAFDTRMRVPEPLRCGGGFEGRQWELTGAGV